MPDELTNLLSLVARHDDNSESPRVSQTELRRRSKPDCSDPDANRGSLSSDGYPKRVTHTFTKGEGGGLRPPRTAAAARHIGPKACGLWALCRHMNVPFGKGSGAVIADLEVPCTVGSRLFAKTSASKGDRDPQPGSL